MNIKDFGVNDWENKFINKLLVGNSNELLKEIPDKSIHMIITSPPYYQQRDYGIEEAIGNETEVNLYIDNLMEIFKECVRILRDDGHIVFNVGDKYEKSSLLLVPYRFAIEVLNKYPVKLINNITWIKLNPTPRQYKKRLVSSTEPFFDFVKSDNYYFDLDSYLALNSFLKKKKKRNNSKIGESYFELINKSNLTENQKEKAKKDLEQAIEEVKNGIITGMRMKIREIHSLPFGGQNGGRKIQLDQNGYTIIRLKGKTMKKDLIESPVETIKGTKHPAVYPKFIIRELIKLLCPRNGIVLDPFIGSGTTAIAAKSLGRRYIGIEINPDYIKFAKNRINSISKTLYEYIL